MTVLQPEDFFAKLKDMDESQVLEAIESFNSISADDLVSYLDYIQKQAPKENFGNDIYDCAGTGGDGADTFNVSTTSAFIAAAAGVKVSKNGGRSTSSKVGSVDVLEALGYKFSQEIEEVKRRLEKNSLVFFTSFITAELLGKVKQTAKKNKIRAFTSMIGPLASPVKLQGQIIGVGYEPWLNTMVETASKLVKRGDRERILVVYSQGLEEDFVLDEFSPLTKSKIFDISAENVREYNFNPKNVDLQLGDYADLKGGESNSENAEIVRSIFSHKELSDQSQVHKVRVITTCMNAAALIYLAKFPQAKDYNEFCLSFRQGYEKALSTVLSGQVAENFESIIMSKN